MVTPSPIRPGDRVADVLARDEALVDVFSEVSPAFERLRNPAMRKVMARLVTVEQAARVARVDLGTLLDQLNAAIGRAPGDRDEGAASDDAGPATPPADPPSAPPAGSAEDHAMDRAVDLPDAPGPGRPPALAAIPADRVVELDVREELRAGREPFSLIMAARREIPDGGALKLRAIFEPAPLYAVLAKQGLEHWTEQLDEEDWVVWFYAPETPGPATTGEAGAGVDRTVVEGAPSAVEGDVAGEDRVVVLDVRGLEPPEPMVRTLAALEALPADATLVQLNVREPRFLLPQLAERGFTYEVRKQSEELVRVFIRHAEGA